MKLVIHLPPRTKKNSQRIFRGENGRTFIAPSKAYKEYEEAAGYFLRHSDKPITEPINLKAVFYMATRHRVDLVNLEEALCDILVRYKVIEDDNFKIVASMDGSRVAYDPKDPRTEIEITRKEGAK